MVALSSFSKIPPLHKPHQTVSCNGYIGFSASNTSILIISVPTKIRMSSIQKKKFFFFAKIDSIVKFLVGLINTKFAQHIYTFGHSVRITIKLLAPVMLCALILYMSGGTYSLKSTPNNRFVRSISWQFVYSQSFCQKSAESKSPEEYFHIFHIFSF